MKLIPKCLLLGVVTSFMHYMTRSIASNSALERIISTLDGLVVSCLFVLININIKNCNTKETESLDKRRYHHDSTV